eukprot:NODE_63_length_25098_cov_0.440498.p18 type:complete len:109 gc:universal NODE_63_length_25098_cov_0.440498:11224-11550(+)
MTTSKLVSHLWYSTTSDSHLDKPIPFKVRSQYYLVNNAIFSRFQTSTNISLNLSALYFVLYKRSSFTNNNIITNNSRTWGNHSIIFQVDSALFNFNSCGLVWFLKLLN